MKRFLLAFGCVLIAAPGVASAALSIAFGEIECAPGEHFVDLVFNETGTPVNEGLFAYDLHIVRNRPGINLLRAEKPDNWVFSSPGASFSQAGPEFTHLPDSIVVNAIGDLLGANQDIVDGAKTARVFYTMDPNPSPGFYSIGLDPGMTLFVSGDTGEAIPVDISDPGGVICWPEPTSLSLLGGVGVPLLQRRRRVK
jgi:hypothetical protein